MHKKTETEQTGILTSQIGYNLGQPMRCLIRSTDKDFLVQAVFQLISIETDDILLRGEVAYWGERWNSYWWEIDFSDLDISGQYKIVVFENETEKLTSDHFYIGEDILWNETIEDVGIAQFEKRAKQARNNNGFKDCGSDLREVNSHACAIIGMCDLIDVGFSWLDQNQIKRVHNMMIKGCDYIAVCQDKAEMIGYPKGAVVHEIPSVMYVLPGDVLKSTVALAKASRLLTEICPEKSNEYLERAEKAYRYMLGYKIAKEQKGFSYMNHGSAKDFKHNGQWMTCDLMTFMWAGYELWLAGRHEYKQDAVRFARKIMKRQVAKDSPEGEFYGHFHTFDGCDFTEKSSTHHHCGFDNGATLPHYIIPFIDIMGAWNEHEDSHLWEKAIRDFAYGYFLPACKQNPFYILPVGYFSGEGLLEFSGIWHGINGTLLFGATLALKLKQCLSDDDFRCIAIGNIQWVAGLNAGLKTGQLDHCTKWRKDDGLRDDTWKSYSQIEGIGSRAVRCWSDIKGSVANGFSVNQQFRLSIEPRKCTDEPLNYCDEDWVPHAGGWISALAYLRQVDAYY